MSQPQSTNGIRPAKINGSSIGAGGNVVPINSHTAAKVVDQRREVAEQRARLKYLHGRFYRWFGEKYDMAALDATLAATAVERLDGIPLWLLLVAGSSTAKTETVITLDHCPRVVKVSTLTTEAALLSATSKDEHDTEATGGILRELGDSGILVFKDVTSILSMNPSTRAPILAALREIYDGEWHRGKGTDGGSRLHWSGRASFIGAVTTAWDKHHAVVAEMGDRFVLLRIDSTDNEARLANGKQAIANTGDEQHMHDELSTLVAGIVNAVNPALTPKVSAEDSEHILQAANLATYARTAVETNYKGDVIDCHAPEGPARLSKQLTQLYRGAVCIGLTRSAAMQLVIRCARDCVPPLRLAVLEDLAAHPGSSSGQIAARLQKPRATVKRVVDSLHVLGLIEEHAATGKVREREASVFSVEKAFDMAYLAKCIGASRAEVSGSIDRPTRSCPGV